MRKLVVPSIVIGFVWFFLVIVLNLIDQVADKRITSVAYGISIVALFYMWDILTAWYDFKPFSKKFFLALAIFAGVSMSLMWTVYFLQLIPKKLHISFGWVLVGWLPATIVRALVPIPRKKNPGSTTD